MEINYTINIMHLNHPQTICSPVHGKIVFCNTQAMVPKLLGNHCSMVHICGSISACNKLLVCCSHLTPRKAKQGLDKGQQIFQWSLISRFRLSTLLSTTPILSAFSAFSAFPEFWQANGTFLRSSPFCQDLSHCFCVSIVLFLSTNSFLAFFFLSYFGSFI